MLKWVTTSEADGNVIRFSGIHNWKYWNFNKMILLDEKSEKTFLTPKMSTCWWRYIKSQGVLESLRYCLGTMNEPQIEILNQISEVKRSKISLGFIVGALSIFSKFHGDWFNSCQEFPEISVVLDENWGISQ